MGDDEDDSRNTRDYQHRRILGDLGVIGKIGRLKRGHVRRRVLKNGETGSPAEDSALSGIHLDEFKFKS